MPFSFYEIIMYPFYLYFTVNPLIRLLVKRIRHYQRNLEFNKVDIVKFGIINLHDSLFIYLVDKVIKKKFVTGQIKQVQKNKKYGDCLSQIKFSNYLYKSKSIYPSAARCGARFT